MRPVLLLAVLLLSLQAIAAEPPFVTAKQLDVIPLLPTPVPTGSPADLAQRALVVAAQKAATPERIALAEHDTAEDVFTMFTSVLGPNFAPQNLPTATQFFTRAGASEGPTINPAKKFYARPRPYLADPAEIQPLVKKSPSGAYPSGHVTKVTIQASLLAAMLPEKHDAIWARAEEYAQSRVIGGMHYPEDLAAARITGSAIVGYLWALPEFTATFAPARDEVRHALGM